MKFPLWGLREKGLLHFVCFFVWLLFGFFVIFLYWEKKKKEEKSQINCSCLPAEKAWSLKRYSILLSKLRSEIESWSGSLRTEGNSHLNLSLASCIHYTFKYMYIHEHIIEMDVQVVCSKKEAEKRD